MQGLSECVFAHVQWTQHATAKHKSIPFAHPRPEADTSQYCSLRAVCSACNALGDRTTTRPLPVSVTATPPPGSAQQPTGARNPPIVLLATMPTVDAPAAAVASTGLELSSPAGAATGVEAVRSGRTSLPLSRSVTASNPGRDRWWAWRPALAQTCCRHARCAW
jgi:hypothetical protein